jgi:hypothetical protein
VRRNLLVDPEALKQVQDLYKAKSESEAVRQALEAVLLVHEARELGEWLASRGGAVDAYERTTGRSRLPVHSDPATIPDDEKERF